MLGQRKAFPIELLNKDRLCEFVLGRQLRIHRGKGAHAPDIEAPDEHKSICGMFFNDLKLDFDILSAAAYLGVPNRTVTLALAWTVLSGVEQYKSNKNMDIVTPELADEFMYRRFSPQLVTIRTLVWKKVAKGRGPVPFGKGMSEQDKSVRHNYFFDMRKEKTEFKRTEMIEEAVDWLGLPFSSKN